MTALALLFYGFAAFAAGIINTIAGGGSFITFPALLLTGLDPRAANVTSTIAMFPMQVTTGYSGRDLAGGTEHIRFRTLFIISLIGGAFGAALLLMTPTAFFGRLVPWLILYATGLFAWGTFAKKSSAGKGTANRLGKWGTIAVQFCISVYGGYFSGGIGILMLAGLTLAGMTIRKASATKNILAAVMNASAVLIFLFSNDIAWPQALLGMPASILGGYVGVQLLHRVNEKKLRIAIIIWGLMLATGLFVRNAL
jgi:uncharacterized protein